MSNVNVSTQVDEQVGATGSQNRDSSMPGVDEDREWKLLVDGDWAAEAFACSGVDAGATMTVGGERPDLPGWFVAPTLLADCTPDMHVVQEEAFGPVVVVLKYSDEEEAINIANNSNYGLYSYIFSGDTSRAYRMATKVESSSVGLNVIQPHMEAPFGGFKMSGVGRDRGIHGLYAYSELQSINWMS